MFSQIINFKFIKNKSLAQFPVITSKGILLKRLSTFKLDI